MQFELGTDNSEKAESTVDLRAAEESKKTLWVFSLQVILHTCSIGLKSGEYGGSINDIPAPNIAISMGCDVGCPFIGRPFDDDGGFPTRQEKAMRNL